VSGVSQIIEDDIADPLAVVVHDEPVLAIGAIEGRAVLVARPLSNERRVVCAALERDDEVEVGFRGPTQGDVGGRIVRGPGRWLHR
jgi:hypothetical protein